MKSFNANPPALNAALHASSATVYTVTRHGRHRRFLSRSAALNNLVHFMVTGTFEKARIPTHEDMTPVWREGVPVYRRGELTERYWNAHHRTHRRVLRLMARQRQIEKWQKNYDAAAQHISQLLSDKPY